LQIAKIIIYAKIITNKREELLKTKSKTLWGLSFVVTALFVSSPPSTAATGNKITLEKEEGPVLVFKDGKLIQTSQVSATWKIQCSNNNDRPFYLKTHGIQKQWPTDKREPATQTAVFKYDVPAADLANATPQATRICADRKAAILSGKPATVKTTLTGFPSPFNISGTCRSWFTGTNSGTDVPVIGPSLMDFTCHGEDQAVVEKINIAPQKSDKVSVPAPATDATTPVKQCFSDAIKQVNEMSACVDKCGDSNSPAAGSPFDKYNKAWAEVSSKKKIQPIIDLCAVYGFGDPSKLKNCASRFEAEQREFCNRACGYEKAVAKLAECIKMGADAAEVCKKVDANSKYVEKLIADRKQKIAQLEADLEKEKKFLAANQKEQSDLETQKKQCSKK
jgi:hypothetical protein